MFIGRAKEMKRLQQVFQSTKFEFGIIHGRRRVGKTTLLKQSIIGKKALYFLSQQVNEEINLEIFSKIYAQYKGLGSFVFSSFDDFFNTLFHEENLIAIIDEFTYLTNSYPAIESKLQGLIDSYKDESTCKLVISGSEVGMLENLFSQSKPLFGRNTFQIHIKECDYYESSLFYPHFSNEDKIRAYAVFGGLPYYLAQVDDQKTLRDNICELIVDENSRFSHEVEMILNTEFRSVQEYQSVLQAIHSGSTRLLEIDIKSHVRSSDKTSKYLKKLQELEIVEKELRFQDKPNSTKYIYRIKNNFIAFYYSFIWKNLSARSMMDPIDFYDHMIAPGLDEFVSHRFETMCQQFLVRTFNNQTNDLLLTMGRYWYNSREERKDIEIDVCLQSTQGLYIYECKWTNDKVGESIMNRLVTKGNELHATHFGAFSKSGYHDSLKGKPYHLVSIEDMF